ncbi:LPS assembly lipoprotein LptE [Terrarubrum flagellatum]|uniref:LPS assembly lipoprotein LptE n=1 Tax=Terrirubrum flagellatum TaxID=2895980 RepID=UPI003144DBFC
MSSPEMSRFSRRAAAFALSALVSLSLAGCFRPLYGETAAGASMQSELAAIEVPEIPDRLGHYLRSELMFMLDGSGTPSPKRYRLTITPYLGQAAAIVDTASARAESATLTGNAKFTLVNIGDGKTIFEGTAVGSATYDRSTQRYATVRAARDAEIRIAKLLADQIRTRVAAAMANRSS